MERIREIVDPALADLAELPSAFAGYHDQVNRQSAAKRITIRDARLLQHISAASVNIIGFGLMIQYGKGLASGRSRKVEQAAETWPQR